MDEISPVTGQRVRRTRFVEREGFTLNLSLFFLEGPPDGCCTRTSSPGTTP